MVLKGPQAQENPNHPQNVHCTAAVYVGLHLPCNEQKDRLYASEGQRAGHIFIKDRSNGDDAPVSAWPEPQLKQTARECLQQGQISTELLTES